MKEHTLTACAQYLQTKIFEFQSSQGRDPSDSSLFLFENVFNGTQLQKLIELLKVPGDLALASVKRLIDLEQQLQHQQRLPN